MLQLADDPANSITPVVFCSDPERATEASRAATAFLGKSDRHRFVSEPTWNTFRDHLILEHEIPDWDGDLGRPNACLKLSAAQCDQKISHLQDCYPSQAGKSWFEANLFRSMTRIRGKKCNAKAALAEAFYLRKLGLSA